MTLVGKTFEIAISLVSKQTNKHHLREEQDINCKFRRSVNDSGLADEIVCWSEIQEYTIATVFHFIFTDTQT